MVFFSIILVSHDALSSIHKVAVMTVPKTQYQAEEHNYIGTIRPARIHQISFQISGHLSRKYYNVGSHIRLNDTLAELDQTEYLKSWKQAKLQADNALITYKQIKEQRKRAEQLVAAHFLSKITYDDALSKEKISAKNYEIALLSSHLSQKQVTETKLKSPVSGVVMQSFAEIGENISAGHPIVALADMSQVEIEFYIPERLKSEISPGMKIEATSPATPGKVYYAFIRIIDEHADPISHGFKVRATIKDSQHIRLYAGMSANVKITFYPKVPKPYFLIPMTSMALDNRTHGIFKIVDNQVRFLPVNIIGVDQENYLITSQYLQPGELIAVNGTAFLRDGLEISIAVKDNRQLLY